MRILRVDGRSKVNDGKVFINMLLNLEIRLSLCISEFSYPQSLNIHKRNGYENSATVLMYDFRVKLKQIQLTNSLGTLTGMKGCRRLNKNNQWQADNKSQRSFR
jgi:hypothetical protein